MHPISETALKALVISEPLLPSRPMAQSGLDDMSVHARMYFILSKCLEISCTPPSPPAIVWCHTTLFLLKSFPDTFCKLKASWFASQVVTCFLFRLAICLLAASKRRFSPPQFPNIKNYFNRSSGVDMSTVTMPPHTRKK